MFPGDTMSNRQRACGSSMEDGPPVRRFRDRADAGRALAGHLQAYARRDEAIVLGLARGGVPVAFEVARALGLPLDVLLVRKLGLPGQEELAMGAIASGGVRVLNQTVLEAARPPTEVIEAVTRRERHELERRERAYRDGAEPLPISGRLAIVVDDGLATGTSMRAAVQSLRQRDAGRIVPAVPVAPRRTCEMLEREADLVVCAVTPRSFRAVGVWYRDFEQTTDDEVRDLLARSRSAGGAGEPAGH
jgi:predicted phosphoribosyltransferase